MSKYEVINEKGKTAMTTEYASSLFDEKVVNAMLRGGYKIKKRWQNYDKERHCRNIKNDLDRKEFYEESSEI